MWPSFLAKLRELCAYADEHNGGWLFAPTRGQRYWSKGFESMFDRAKELLDYEHQEWANNGRQGEASLRFSFSCQSLRHYYASNWLMRTEAGGLGWSVGLVQRSLGHKDQRMTEGVYRHMLDLEYVHAINTPHRWPGL